MTLLLDAYFSLSSGLKSSSMPFVEIATFTNLEFHKFFLPAWRVTTRPTNHFFFLGERIMTIWRPSILGNCST